MSPPRTENSAPLLLASRSARRRALLEEHGIAHEPIETGVDDGGLEPGGVPPGVWAVALAYLKAAAGADAAGRTGRPGGLVLGADTICVQDGEVFGQAADADAARRMLLAFRGRTHGVITGVALLEPQTGRRDLFFDSVPVTWGVVGEGEIDRYVASGEWRGKAGAYNLVERLAAGWPITYSGDWTTIVGLPMARLPARIERFRRQGEPARGRGSPRAGLAGAGA